jgi:hypothetical protein
MNEEGWVAGRAPTRRIIMGRHQRDKRRETEERIKRQKEWMRERNSESAVPQ